MAGKRQTILPLPSEGFGSFDFWKKEITAGERKRDDDYKPDWDHNIKSYLAKPLISTPDIDKIIVPKDFSNVEQKKAQLFFQLPQIQCVAQNPDHADAVPLAQAVLRFYLSRHRTNAMGLMNEVLFDVLCPAGLMASKIGYESIQDGTVPMPMPGSGPPTPQPGSILGLGATSPPPPEMQDVPRIISERYFWERISPAKLLMPERFTGSNYDLAPWLGFEFVEPWDLTKRKYNLSEEDIKFSGDDDHKIRSEKNITTRAQTNTVRGWEIWYKASLYDSTEKHPDKIRLLILLEGLDRPVRHVDSPYQRFDPQTGKLTVGMKGFPVHVGALRYVSDSSYPPSECSISRAQVDELGKFRTQMVLLRDRAVPTVFFDQMRIGGEQTAQKIRRGILGAWVDVPGLDVNNPPAVEAVKAHTNQDNYRANDYINRDIEEVWAFGPNQLSQEALESRSATEMSIAQQNASARIGKDRERVVEYFLTGTEKLWSLLQLFADTQEYVEILGQDGARRLAQWDKTSIAGEFVFEAKADSAAQPDYATDRNLNLKAYELLAKDPNVNRIEILHKVAQAFDYDPARLIIEQLPPKPPEPAKISLTLKGDELDIGRPEFPILLAVLRQSGYNLPDELIQQAQQHRQIQSAVMAMSGIGDPSVSAGMVPASAQNVGPTMTQPQEHGGMAPRAERLNKHQEKQTAERRGPKALQQRPS